MAKQFKLVISDFHLGKGHSLSDGLPNPFEDFHLDRVFAELLAYYSTGSGRQGADEVELVINGDFFDYLAVDVSGRYPEALFEDVALESTKLICQGHDEAMSALRLFAATPGCSIRYNMGNHDPAIVWPSVQAYLETIIGAKILFAFDDYSFDDVRIEHGHQHEVQNQFDTRQLVLPAGVLGREKPVINFPFGCFFVTQYLNKMRKQRAYIHQVVPFRLYLRWAFINDFWFALKSGIGVCLFFITMRFIRHPYRFSRFSKTMRILRDVLHPPDLEKVARRTLTRAPFRVLIMGHNHEACLRTYASGKQYANSGTWSSFTSFDPALLGHHILRSYVFLERSDDEPWRVSLRLWNGVHRVEEPLVM